jgi:site-specific recombinase XerD
MSHRTDFQLKDILKYNKDGSFDARQTRYKQLTRFISHMQNERGYATHWNLNKLGKKEIHRYVRDLKDKGLEHRTIENNLGSIRWLATKINREHLMPSNRDCGLKKREFSTENKAVRLTSGHLASMDDRMKLINRLKSEFGLREKEALKFDHRYATASQSKIQLKDNWCKNGRPRSINIVNDQQVQLLQDVEKFQKANVGEHFKKTGTYSMIPDIKQMKFNAYRKQVQDVSKEIGIKGHSFRHQWAQDRFKELSGLDCPIANGPKYSELDQEQKNKWDAAAGIVNQELGHGKDRLDTTATYIGIRS